MVMVSCKGQPVWVLAESCNNRGNTAPIERVYTWTQKTKVSTTKTENYLRQHAVDVDSKNKVLADSKLASFSIKGESSLGVKASVLQKLEFTKDERGEQEVSVTLTHQWTCGPNCAMELYRLEYRLLGYAFATNTFATVPLGTAPPSTTSFDVVGDAKRAQWLKRLDVVVVGKPVDEPNHGLQEVDGLSTDVNKGFGGAYVYLVPVWTNSVAEACTGIDLIVQGEGDERFVDLAAGAGGQYRYLKMRHDRNCDRRISKIALWRSTRGHKPTWSHQSADLNKGRKGDYLWICWETMAV